MSFLSSLNVGSAAPGRRSPAQIAGLISTIVSLVSGLLGILLYRRLHVQRLETAADAVRICLQADARQCVDDTGEQATYLQSHSNRVFGFENLAIAYSLPYGLLIWS